MTKILFSKIVEFATGIEDAGYEFYNKISSKTKDPKIKRIFTSLAKAELQHKKTFANMLKDKSVKINTDLFPEEYYFEYASKVIFDKEKLENEYRMIDSPIDALNFGIRRELDTILYYQELNRMIDENKIETQVENIIKEERKHFMKLTNYKEELENQK
ncbi:MAG: ferritin family protein [Candidatus Mcinerneyibacterium aminivorans]|jgi:rubrerythrin|uniref:Ferritin family protein n=1 Tax=Candidatus Mcinerneyibacterium aminivorans TaxID=2703815 RepID=A0A5D0MGV0_9BACT|nr:MAG: ferritin family protein [Candidatus Mcinerneyibacterium aminivorans]